MRICHIASEISPIAKVGGLADVTLGLSREVQNLGHHVTVILPKYACLKHEGLEHLTPYKTETKVYFDQKWHPLEITKATVHGVPVILIESASSRKYFNQSQIYGYPDDPVRFAFLSCAALAFLKEEMEDINVIHMHDWQTALIAPLFHEFYQRHLKARLIFTIHNLGYQGLASFSLLTKVGLDKKKYGSANALKDPKRDDRINLMKGAIIFSDAVTTVSPQYALEIQEPFHAKGLEKVIRQNTDKIFGILNGIDYKIWNPEHDEALASKYTPHCLEKKAADKKYLREILKLPLLEKSPLVTCICRLVPQKGLRMIKKAISSTLKLGGQFVLFGSSPIEKIQKDFERLDHELDPNPNVRFIFDSYNERLAHQIYAGADIIICPSIFEPCGLTQLIALQYGTVPLVRKTGGLANTVFDIEEDKEYPNKTNGFTFIPPTSKAIHETLKRAFSIYRERPELWKEIIQRGMTMDFSWGESAKHYLELYHFNPKKMAE